MPESEILIKLRENQAARHAELQAKFQRERDEQRSELQAFVSAAVRSITDDIEGGGVMYEIHAAKWGMEWQKEMDQWTRENHPGFRVMAPRGREGLIVYVDGVYP